MTFPTLEDIQGRKKEGVQSTIHQQDGAETAELFGEPKRTALYAKIFKKNPFARAVILDTRSWCLKVGKEPSKLFMKMCKKYKWLK